MSKRKRKTRRQRQAIADAIYGVCVIIFLYALTEMNKPDFKLKCIFACMAIVGILVLLFALKYLKRKRYLNSDLSKIDKMKGIDFEYYLKDKFKKYGYSAKVTPASNDYGADLIVSKNGMKIAVQAKRWQGKINNSAVQEITAAIKYYKCDGGMIIANSDFTANALNLANANSIIVWDRNKLRHNFVEDKWDGNM